MATYTDPWPDFQPGAVADANQVDARFAVLYGALAGGIGTDNLTAGARALLIATGDLVLSGRAMPREGYLTANGSPVSRTTYAALFAEYGTRFGDGDGTSTFNLPNASAPAGLTYYVKT